jgi:hypothetical protein
MTAKSFSINRGVDIPKISDVTVGTLAPNANDVELRFNLTDTNGKNLTKLDVVKALNAFVIAIESGSLFTTLPGI